MPATTLNHPPKPARTRKGGTRFEPIPSDRAGNPSHHVRQQHQPAWKAERVSLPRSPPLGLPSTPPLLATWQIPTSVSFNGAHANAPCEGHNRRARGAPTPVRPRTRLAAAPPNAPWHSQSHHMPNTPPLTRLPTRLAIHSTSRPRTRYRLNWLALLEVESAFAPGIRYGGNDLVGSRRLESSTCRRSMTRSGQVSSSPLAPGNSSIAAWLTPTAGQSKATW